MKKQILTLVFACTSLALAAPSDQPKNIKVSSKEDAHFGLDTVLIQDWIDKMSLTNILEHGVKVTLDDMKIDRNFRDYLVLTEDREQMERRRGED